MSASLSPSSDSSIPDDPAVKPRLRAKQLALMCQQSRSALISAAVFAWYVCWLLSSQYSLLEVGGWYALLLVVTALRLLVQERFLAHYSEKLATQDLPRHTLYVLIGLVVNGAVWGLPSTWLLISDPAKQVLMTVFLVGLSAAGISSLAPMRHAYAAFVVPFMLPIAVDYIFFIGHEFVNVGIGIAAYAFAMIATAHRSSASIEGALHLQFANAELAEREHREKAIVERANRDLEMQIAQRERTEAELRVAKSEAEAANRAKNQFLANMSHELRTPLNGVLGMSDLLLRALPATGAAAKSRKHAETIRAAGERLLHLINDILDMARIEAGAIRFESETFNPRSLIAEAIESATEMCSGKSLTLRAAIDDDVPNELCGDVYRLRQVLTNLIANAIKFTDEGTVEVTLKVMSRSNEGSKQGITVRWAVKDTGIGIAPESRAQLFRPFSQLDNSFTRRFGGTGLGLAICHQIVTALHGRIDVESTPGRGSTFWFETPLEISNETIHASAENSKQPVKFLGGHLLVVEDNETNCQLIAEMLELVGCTSRKATDGAEALDRLSAETFDAVLMDWHMPKMDGLAATKAWREIEQSKRSTRLPIIALTASVLPGDRETCLKAGMDDFVAKPFTYDELIDSVAKWLAKSKARSAASA